jgi:hypothetical protein
MTFIVRKNMLRRKLIPILKQRFREEANTFLSTRRQRLNSQKTATIHEFLHMEVGGSDLIL